MNFRGVITSSQINFKNSLDWELYQMGSLEEKEVSVA
jgi:hypothetical protein